MPFGSLRFASAPKSFTDTGFISFSPTALRWPVKRTNTSPFNFSQLRSNTNRKTIYRVAQLTLAIALLLTTKFIEWGNRYSPAPAPIH